ncbi:MAG: hypothetical protein LBD22_00320 [Spirochaetaceae bacterium]|jgi:hypothetical protein|nr:hypothetical protein [Spirochaetaceae bacterium]
MTKADKALCIIYDIQAALIPIGLFGTIISVVILYTIGAIIGDLNIAEYSGFLLPACALIYGILHIATILIEYPERKRTEKRIRDERHKWEAATAEGRAMRDERIERRGEEAEAFLKNLAKEREAARLERLGRIASKQRMRQATNKQ